jgi:hypothetical protein
MRVDPSSAPAILALASDTVSFDAPVQVTWPSVFYALLGSGGLLTVIKYVAQPFATWMRARTEREAAALAAEQARKKARHDAELKQTEVVTTLAQSVPTALEKLSDRIDAHTEALVSQLRADREMVREEMRSGFDKMREALTVTTRAVEANTAATDALTGELYNESRDSIAAIAEKVGAARRNATIEAAHVPPPAPSTGVRPRLASSPR